LILLPFRFIGGLFATVLTLSPMAAHAAPLDATATTARVLDLTNAERQKAGLPPLVLNTQLSQAAQQYSQVLSRDSCFAHTCGPVPDMVQRVLQAGYGNWSAVGENIAAGYTSPEALVAGWMNSPGHRANILSPKYREIGIGLVNGGKYGAYWTQDFGSRWGADPAPAPAFQSLHDAAPDVIVTDDEDDE
jgi:uncharacterized protein YkwD